jgi:hypothetical protein
MRNNKIFLYNFLMGKDFFFFYIFLRTNLTPYAWSEHVNLDYEMIETALGLLQNKIEVAVGTCSSVKRLNPKNLSSSACLCLNA